MCKSREVLIYLAMTFNGDWERIYNFVVNKYEVPKDEEIYRVISKLESKAVTFLDEEYPVHLRESYRPPFVLFYHGDISLLNDYDHTLAIIGTRKPSEYGVMMTKKIVDELGGRYIIVSGMAIGIDSLAQSETMTYGGRTIAVLGAGINNCYISSLLPLYNEIKERHLIVSEYPNNYIPSRISFPMRNRIIAALSKCLLVTEAHYHSGTSITVGFASMGQTNVLAIPERANEDSLCNTLIKEGAALITNGFDVMDEMEGRKFSLLFPPR